jgi:ankyrin repeat protein
MAAQQGNENLIRLLLREGAHVNSPARGHEGYTALQAACQWFPATEEEHQRKMRICRLPIKQGADINASPSEEGGRALGLAAQEGDLELAVLLLREGADVNALDLPLVHSTALDRAALHGRLDVVKFLLNANALSGRRGATGYVGTISTAETIGYLAVADLLREHAAKVEAGTVFNPELLKAQETCSVYGYITDDEPSDNDYESSSDDDAEDMGVAGGTCGPKDSESGYREAAQTVSQGGKAVP